MKFIDNRLLDSFVEAEKSWRTADHLVYVTYPVVKDNKLLLRSLENCYKSAVSSISIILRYEFIHKRVVLSRESDKNLETFFKKCSRSYGIEQDEGSIRKLLTLARKHRESSFEFSQKEKVVMMNDSGKIEELRVEQIKEFLSAVRNILESIRKIIK